MLKHARTITGVAAAAALFAAPAAGLAGKGHGHGHGHGHGATHGKARHCTPQAHSVGYQVRGTLVSTPSTTRPPRPGRRRSR